MKQLFFIATSLFVNEALAFGGGFGGGAGSTVPFFSEHLLSVFAVAALAIGLIKNKL